MHAILETAHFYSRSLTVQAEEYTGLAFCNNESSHPLPRSLIDICMWRKRDSSWPFPFVKKLRFPVQQKSIEAWVNLFFFSKKNHIFVFSIFPLLGVFCTAGINLWFLYWTIVSVWDVFDQMETFTSPFRIRRYCRNVVAC